MAVVLISRGTLSGGQEVAECLAERLHVRCVSREDLVALVDREGAHAKKVVESISTATHAYQQFSRDRRPYIVLMRRAFLELIRQGDLVYHGFACHFLVSDLSRCLKVRVNAPIEYRVEKAKERLHLSNEEALEHIRTEDETRVRWARFMYGRDVRDPTLYDICFCLRYLSVDFVSTVLAASVDRPELQPSPEQRREFNDMFLAACVDARLVSDPATSELEIGANSTGGRILLEGPYLKPQDRETVERIATAVPGVRDVTYRAGYGSTFERVPFAGAR